MRIVRGISTTQPEMIVLTAILSLLHLAALRGGVAAETVPGEMPVCLPDDPGCHPPCGLYLAPSTQHPESLGLFAGVEREAGQPVPLTPDLMVEMFDASKNEWSPWQDFFWMSDVVPSLDNEFERDLFLPGIPSLSFCQDDPDLVNIVMPSFADPTSKRTVDSLGVHRSKHPTAGSFTYHAGYSYDTLVDISPGEELFASCEVDQSMLAEERRAKPAGGIHPKRSLSFLSEHGICLDTLEIKESTIPNIGRGAFSKFGVKTGQAIATTPVLHFDRSQLHRVVQSLDIYQKIPNIRAHGIHYHADQVLQQQLVLNYCYGHPDSNILLLPIGSGVNAINHNREYPNAYIRWVYFSTSNGYMHSLSPHDLLDEALVLGLNEDSTQMWIQIVALRDIQPGEEVFLNYGNDWQKAFDRHVQEFEAKTKDIKYISAADYVRQLQQQQQNAEVPPLLRTKVEQETDPFPENLQTACYFKWDKKQEITVTSTGHSVEWVRARNYACLRPCDILERTQEADGVYYTVQVFASKFACGRLPKGVAGGLQVTRIPQGAVRIMDKPYTNDALMVDSFRHEIGVPEAFWPKAWMAKDPRAMGDFIPTPLKPGDLQPIRWADNGKIVTRNGYRLGLSPKLREVLLEYCEKMGITDLFRHLTLKGNALEPGDNAYLELDGEQWYLQRPEAKWQSNLQWLSPGDNPAHEHYLQALSVAGFDEMLQSIGEALQLDSLVAFHVTFIAVSHSTRGYMHHDVTETGDKTFNVIVPLILANETGPELDVQDDGADEEGEDRVGRYRYEYNVASLMGDDAYHASSAVDYRTNKEMRMAATIYIADVNEDNVYNILKQYTQAYPPNDAELLLSWAGRHWRRDDPSVKLPKPSPDHILVADKTVKDA